MIISLQTVVEISLTCEISVLNHFRKFYIHDMGNDGCLPVPEIDQKVRNAGDAQQEVLVAVVVSGLDHQDGRDNE